uniref:Uncharacterized protein n=1 Tax=Arundo donax TaxID=35708 RepID=A0A0A8ZLX0_ARUDO
MGHMIFFFHDVDNKIGTIFPSTNNSTEFKHIINKRSSNKV